MLAGLGRGRLLRMPGTRHASVLAPHFRRDFERHLQVPTDTPEDDVHTLHHTHAEPASSFRAQAMEASSNFEKFEIVNLTTAAEIT